ncbi:MAG: hypothetical protein G01um101425_482 [Candidatus Peregrinibacteria bacterium Gr01-1014_25]|nr:MAG: hypothetical protein G01um101425_482 [Candidatus Peregrinibacteria bacterium Gr01-1014_25]
MFELGISRQKSLQKLPTALCDVPNGICSLWETKECLNVLRGFPMIWITDGIPKTLPSFAMRLIRNGDCMLYRLIQFSRQFFGCEHEHMMP